MIVHAIDREDLFSPWEIDRIYSLLPPVLVKRIDAKKKEEDRKKAILAHGIWVSWLLEKKKISWGDLNRGVEVSLGERGKPQIPLVNGFHFNISHCKKGVLTGISNQPIGVDMQEYVVPTQGMKELVLNNREKEELEALRQSDPAGEQKGFTKMWTLKESYTKCLGTGIDHQFRGYDFAGVDQSFFSRFDRNFAVMMKEGYCVAVCGFEKITGIIYNNRCFLKYLIDG